MIECKKVSLLGRMGLMNRKCERCGQDAGEKDVYCVNCGSLLKECQGENQTVEKESVRSQTGNQAPLTLGDYMFIGLILLIPVVNIVILLIWALDKHGNLNRRNLAKAGLIYLGIGIALSIVLGIGLVRAVYLDQRIYYDENYYDYQIDDPDFNDWSDLPFDTEET